MKICDKTLAATGAHVAASVVVTITGRERNEIYDLSEKAADELTEWVHKRLDIVEQPVASIGKKRSKGPR
tara:strand:- start:3795 stop:4004 length:210 start_codon:yes stop_codon:yes gene_type:complete